jgi:hypothetical protein
MNKNIEKIFVYVVSFLVIFVNVCVIVVNVYMLILLENIKPEISGRYINGIYYSTSTAVIIHNYCKKK